MLRFIFCHLLLLLTACYPEQDADESWRKRYGIKKVDGATTPNYAPQEKLSSTNNYPHPEIHEGNRHDADALIKKWEKGWEIPPSDDQTREWKKRWESPSSS